MTDDIRLEGDGEIQITDIEASVPEGRKPRIRTKPAYSHYQKVALLEYQAILSEYSSESTVIGSARCGCWLLRSFPPFDDAG